MAFSFFGTYTTAQFEELRKFSKIQERDIQDRITWLDAAISRNGIFITNYDEQSNLPTSFTCLVPSYGSKLLSAYRALGGNPERDFMLRTRNKPVFLERGKNISSDIEDSNSGYSETFTNGRRIRGDQRFDRDVGIVVNKLKSFQYEAIKRKREHLEYKIKRCMDYSDQLQSEKDALELMLSEDAFASVDDLTAEVFLKSSRTGAQNVVDDSEDIFGLNIGKPKDPTFLPDYENSESEALR